MTTRAVVARMGARAVLALLVGADFVRRSLARRRSW